MAATADVSFAQGMFVTLWPKVERCHDYVELLLAAQETLQHTVDKLMAGRTLLPSGSAQCRNGVTKHVSHFIRYSFFFFCFIGLQEADKADACSIERYADRLRHFPVRVETLEKKLVRIRARLVAMKKAQGHDVRATSEQSSVYATTPLF